MIRLPILPTACVALAVGAMIALGFWQLERASEKTALLALYAKADTLPAMAYPAVPQNDDILFRKAGGFCLEPFNHRIEGGLSAKNTSGWRHLVDCRTGAEGPGMTVDIGWSQRFADKIEWKGGDVTGVIAQQPDHRSLIGKAMGRGTAPGLMLVALVPADGLSASAPPSIDSVPNNHFSYAVQWFLFAGIAAVIYGLALRRRQNAP